MARCGTLRSICIEESNTVSAGREMPARTPSDEADAAADDEPLQRPLGRDGGMGDKRAVAQAFPEGGGHRARSRQQAGRHHSAARSDLPYDHEADRQRP